jgi:predicted PurR-regulated permease PerM
MTGIESARHSDRRLRAAEASVIIIAVVLVVGALSLGRAVFVPVTLAVVMATVLRPAVQLLQRLRVPSPAAATIVVVATLALLFGVGAALEDPVSSLATDLPTSIATARARFGDLTSKFRSITGSSAGPAARSGSGAGTARRSASAVKGADSTRSDGVPSIEPAGAIRSAFGVTTSLLVEIVEEVLLVLFLLAAGSDWMNKLANIARSPERAAHWTSIAGEMHGVVSRYLLVTLLINVGQAILIGLAVWAIGLPSPAVWGALTFVAEFIPYLGGLTMVALLLLAGLTGGEGLAHALLAPATYLLVTTLQNNLVSPVAYGRGLRLNPTMILIAVMFWWMIWGVAGAFVAVPILASLRVLGSRVPALTPLSVLLQE